MQVLLALERFRVFDETIVRDCETLKTYPHIRGSAYILWWPTSTIP
jgi:hypothetical protein